MNELITGDNERIVNFICNLDRILEEVRRFTETNRPVLNGERFLTDKELASKLKVSRRTLLDYRNEGRIPYILLGGKVLYRESDIERMLRNAYREAYRQTDW